LILRSLNVLLFAALTLFPSLVTASGSFAMVAKSEIYRKSSTLLKNFLVHGDLHSVAENLLSAKDPLNTFEIKKPSYDRGSFGKWTDADKDCLNTRHEILKELSTAVTNRDAAGCKIVSGRWLDPYTDRSFYNSRELHVDHLVPLAYPRGTVQRPLQPVQFETAPSLFSQAWFENPPPNCEKLPLAIFQPSA
jgi:hypothetical protein